MTNQTKNVVLEYRLNVNGIYGRNRKAKFQSLHLKDVAPDMPLSEAEVAALVTVALADIKAKPGIRWTVKTTEVTIEVSNYNGNIVTSRSQWLFESKTVAQGVVAC